MSYFSTEKRMNLSILGIYTANIDTALSSTFADSVIFGTETQVQMASSIGYPIITTTGAQINLEAGWKYVIDVRLKATDTTPSTTENIQYVLTDTSNNHISSVGSLIFYRETAYSYIQEKCIVYQDCLSTGVNLKLRVLKVGGGAGGQLNVSGDAGSSSFRCHILIKAWK